MSIGDSGIATRIILSNGKYVFGKLWYAGRHDIATIDEVMLSFSKHVSYISFMILQHERLRIVDINGKYVDVAMENRESDVHDHIGRYRYLSGRRGRYRSSTRSRSYNSDYKLHVAGIDSAMLHQYYRMTRHLSGV